MQIKCENVSMSYENKTVLEAVDFSINKGEYWCIIGENGTGKSTLIKGLLGLKTPNTGSIVYGDGLKQNDIGYLPQSTAVQKDFPASVREVVLSGLLNNSGGFFFKNSHRERVTEILDYLGIKSLIYECFRDLSGGQQQRVLLARALCAAGKVLLLDEPMASLDPVATSEMYELISKLNADGLTVIMVSHDISAAFKNASHILHLKHTPVFCGTKEEYLSTDDGKAYLEGAHHH